MLDELTAILGSGRFKALLKHLRTHFPSLRDANRLARPASAVDEDTHHEQCCTSVENEQESLRCDELVAEIEQRVTQMENVLTRYSSRYTTRGIQTNYIHTNPPEFHLQAVPAPKKSLFVRTGAHGRHPSFGDGDRRRIKCFRKYDSSSW